MRYISLLFVFISAGCTTLQYSGTNNTDQALVYTVNVDGKKQANDTVVKDKPLPPTLVGKYKHGSDVEILVTLPVGGQVSSKFNKLPSEPDPYTMDLTISSIPGVRLDLGKAADIENAISDVSGSFMSPTPLVDNLIGANLNGIFLCTDNRDNPAKPKCKTLFLPTDLNSKAPTSFYSDNQFPMQFVVSLILDKTSATSIAAEVPSIATVNADFAASEIYKYELNLDNTGWRTSPISWYSVQTELLKTDKGKDILNKLKKEFSTIGADQHIYYLDKAYIIGKHDVSTYQGKRLTNKDKVDVNSYLALNAAYSMSNDKFDTKKGKNIVLRVGYSELHLQDVDSGLVHDLSSFKQISSNNKTRIISVPAVRPARIAN